MSHFIGNESLFGENLKENGSRGIEMFGIILLFATTGEIVLFLKLKLKLVLINNSPNILQNGNTM